MTVLRFHPRAPRALSACLVALALLACGAPRAEAAQVRAHPKTDYPVTVPIEIPIPNVLFLLDVGSQMVFTPKGIMPMAERRGNQFVVSPDRATAAERLAECTYGMGSHPVTGGEPGVSGPSAWRWGRDLDNGNNEIGSADCYYSSKPGNPYFLTFKDGRLPAGVRRGMKVTGYPKYTNSPYPEKPFSPNEDAYNQLVPNDSRMYMMKLVLWRLTEPENAELLSGMNVAVATNIQDESRPLRADVYKYPPYGREGIFKYGRAPDWSIGDADGWGGYSNSVYTYIGVLRDHYSATPGLPTWNHVHRAILLAPFDRFYKEDAPGRFSPTPHLARFRKYIDGVETIKNGRFENPELFADGQSPISTALYARDYLMRGSEIGKDIPGKDAIRYAPSDVKWGNGDRINLVTSTTTDGLMAGQAVGSAIDFFSPLKLPFNDGAGFFPVQGSCQSNWVVVFTAGNDEQEGKWPDGKPLRTAPEAALELYKNSVAPAHALRGRMRAGSGWQEMSYAMDKGIRTLVVGFVNENATDANSKKLIKSLNEIAANGRPKKQGDEWVKDENQKALFANDVPKLIESMLSVLKLINADAKSGGGLVGSPKIVMQEDVDEGRVYALSYDPQLADQWAAEFSCHDLSILGTGAISMDSGIWRAGALMDQAGSSRRIYTPLYDAGTRGQNVTELRKVSPESFARLANVPEGEVEKFRRWLCRPKDVDQDTKATPLGDSQHSNFLKVDRASDSSDIFLQTNRGILHALDAATGAELWAFIPPNAFQGRIRAMKFDPAGRWYNGKGSTADDYRSVALVTLDGLMSQSALDSADQQSVLLATTGYGGSGIYAVDVTNRETTPQFLWAVDNVRYTTPEPNPMDGVRRWGAAAPVNATDPRDFNYSSLGLTLQAAALIPVSTDQYDVVGVLPGGLGYNLGRDDQGKAIYVLDPRDGSILNRLDGRKLEKHPGAPADLGMVLAPIVPVSKKDKTLEFFTSDSSGNILNCAMTTGSGGDRLWNEVSDWKLRSVFRLNTVDKGGQDTGKPASSHYRLRRLVRLRDGMNSLVGATCNTLAPGSGTDKTRQVKNEQQFVFLLRLDRLSETSSMKDLAMRTLREVSEKNNAAASHSLHLNEKVQGWFFRMEEAMGKYEAEEPSMAPYLYNGNLFVPTFKQEKAADAPCTRVDSGVARLYVLDAETGYGSMKSIEMEGLKIVGVTGLRGRLLLSVEEKRAGALNEAAERLEGQRVGNNMLNLSLPEVAQPDYVYGIPFNDYWRDLDLNGGMDVEVSSTI
mgnify:CR=1 FL=1